MPLKQRLGLPTAVSVAVFCFAAPLAYAIVRPVEVLQSVAGFACANKRACAEDPSRLAEASALYESAAEFLALSVAPLQRQPLAVFCSTPSCYAFTGESGSAAKTVGRFVIVISPRGWKPYIVRHEMIHRLQSEKLGVFGMYAKPEWFVEGMAYALSQDPRNPLIEPFETDRATFREWYAVVGKERLWSTPPNP